MCSSRTSGAGTLEKWNLGYEELSAANPGIVVARISGYGQTGPYAKRAGFASVAEAMGDLRYISAVYKKGPEASGMRRARICAPDHRPGTDTEIVQARCDERRDPPFDFAAVIELVVHRVPEEGGDVVLALSRISRPRPVLDEQAQVAADSLRGGRRGFAASRGRASGDWPEVTARPVPPMVDHADGQAAACARQDLLGVAIALDTMNTGETPAIDPKTATGQQAHEYVLERQARIGRDSSALGLSRSVH